MNQPEITMAAVKMILSLLIVLGLLWAVYRWTRRSLSMGQGGSSGRLIKILANHYLGMKKAITVVEVPGAVLVLGISADRVNLLSRIDDPEVLAAVQKTTGEATPARRFRDQLQRLTGVSPAKLDAEPNESTAGQTT
jgi:flagellar protein FliO/FliZ